MTEFQNTEKGTPRNAANGSTTGKTAQGSVHRGKSSPSAEPSSDSKRPWPVPRSVREFTAQANRVATRVLNGEIDLETARVFSSIARTVAQTVSSETVRARMLRQAPDLDFDFPEDES